MHVKHYFCLAILFIFEGKDNDVTTYSPKYPTVHNDSETIQTECTYTIVEVSVNHLDVMWLVCTSEKYNISIDYCTGDGDGKLNCSGLLTVTSSYYDYDYDGDKPRISSTIPPLRETSKHEPPTTSIEPSLSESMTVIVTLGVTVGLLVALLGIATTGWIWMYLKMTRKKKPSEIHEDNDE